MADSVRKELKSSVKSSQGAAPRILVPQAKTLVDWATILGLIFSVIIIIIAVTMSESNASFIQWPALALVVGGTLTVTAISYTAQELAQAGNVFKQSVLFKHYDPEDFAIMLMNTAVTTKKTGLLSLAKHETEFEKHPFLKDAMLMAADGNKPDDVNAILMQDINALSERHKRTASVTRRAAEIAPAMGLIGTLVGLVQMLADLEDPETIGPAMALALLTTFYGAILGTVIMSPLAIKLEKYSKDEMLIRHLIRLTAISIARQDNPRKLEMELNSALPPTHQIIYFD